MTVAVQRLHVFFCQFLVTFKTAILQSFPLSSVFRLINFTLTFRLINFTLIFGLPVIHSGFISLSSTSLSAAFCRT